MNYLDLLNIILILQNFSALLTQLYLVLFFYLKDFTYFCGVPYFS